MMMNKLFIGFVMLFIFPAISAQTLYFRTSEIEEGVKEHLGLTKSDKVIASQLDTITQLNLSGFGITDLRDIRLMPNLKKVNLSYNKIDDISALATMSSLQEVDLSYNQLESINLLAFSNAKEMVVDVAYNYITDFSFFEMLTPCVFTLKGAGLQLDRNAPYFHLSYLYSDGTSKNPAIYCMLNANTNEKVQMTVHNVRTPVYSDGKPHVYILNDDLSGTEEVVVTDGIYSDTTYLVTNQTIHVDPEKTVTIETNLPDCYELGYCTSSQGELDNDGTNLLYSASADFNYEEVIYTFFQNCVLKGISKVNLTKEQVTDGIRTPMINRPHFDLSYDNNMLNIFFVSEGLAKESFVEVYDITGKTLAKKYVDSSHVSKEQIPIGYVKNSVIIVRVSSGKKIYTEKLLVQ